MQSNIQTTSKWIGMIILLSLSRMLEILGEVEIVYEGEVIPQENVIKAYSDFLLASLCDEDHNVDVVLHNGSLCFDIVTVVLFVMSCLELDDTAAEDIIKSLKPGEHVIYERSRAIFKGINENGYAVIYQEKKYHGYISPITSTVAPVSFYKIKPYNGGSTRLDGRGIRSNTTERSKFIKSVFKKTESEISSITQKSAIILADKFKADSLVRGISLRYDQGRKSIDLMQLITISYFTESEEYRYPGNPSKNPAVLRFMSKPSLAREMIIDDESENIVGLAIMGKYMFDYGRTELINLVQRRSLKFSLISYPIELDDYNGFINEFQNHRLFACTSLLLSHYGAPTNCNGKLTLELQKKVEFALNKRISPTIINHMDEWDVSNIKKEIHSLRVSSEFDEDIETFIINAFSLINLFSSAIFPLKELELLISSQLLSVRSPQHTLDSLLSISNNNIGIHAEKMKYIYEQLKSIYVSLYHSNSKFDVLVNMFRYSGAKKRWAIVVPKSYYKKIFMDLLYKKTKREFDCYIETYARFDSSHYYDEVIVIGQLSGKKFDLFRNLSSMIFALLQYNFETNQYKFKESKYRKMEKQYNDNMKFISIKPEENIENDTYLEEPITIDDSLQEFVDAISYKKIIEYASNIKSESTDTVQSEVFKVAQCTNGETIFFTRYFTPYLIDYSSSEVIENDVSKLTPGDTLIFTTNTSESKDIVNEILEGLINRDGRDHIFLKENYERSIYWKKALKEYMNKNGYSYKDISNQMKQNGIQKHEVTLRAWLNEEFHIVGPRDIESYRQIALICNDTKMLNDPESYCEACNVIRAIRVRILKSIGQAVVKNYMKSEGEDDIYEYISPKINELSQIVQIETIRDADNLKVPAYMTNKPQFI